MSLLPWFFHNTLFWFKDDSIGRGQQWHSGGRLAVLLLVPSVVYAASITAASDALMSQADGAGLRTETLAAGLDHTCGLKTDGTLACWGDNGYGQASIGPPDEYTYCAAGETGTCSFSETKNVAYGANGKFFYRTVADGVACNQTTFGGDQIPGIVKACYIR